jgi:hypothetical protein
MGPLPHRRRLGDHPQQILVRIAADRRPSALETCAIEELVPGVLSVLVADGAGKEVEDDALHGDVTSVVAHSALSISAAGRGRATW